MTISTAAAAAAAKDNVLETMLYSGMLLFSYNRSTDGESATHSTCIYHGTFTNHKLMTGFPKHGDIGLPELQTASTAFPPFTNRLVCHDLHIIASCLAGANVALAVLALLVSEAFAVLLGRGRPFTDSTAMVRC